MENGGIDEERSRKRGNSSDDVRKRNRATEPKRVRAKMALERNSQV